MPDVGCLTKRVERRLHETVSGEPSLADELQLDEQFCCPGEDDTATLVEQQSAPAAEFATHTCYVNLFACWSATYQVPVMYFQAFTSSGAPLSMDQVVYQANIFRIFANNTYPWSTLSDANRNETADSGRHMPFLSQGDHPVTGEPAWFLHPCETSTVLSDVLDDGSSSGDEDNLQSGMARWLDAWFMIVDSVLRLE
ncbi:hypothetical protein ACM66B_005642 [Microbotryomycetes sp. NB124-2]